MNEYLKCPHCGCRFNLPAYGASKDNLGWHTSCPRCEQSFDVNIESVLIPRGTRVHIFEQGDLVGVVDGNDAETSEEFDDINYCVVPYEFLHKESWSDNYLTCRRIELISSMPVAGLLTIWDLIAKRAYELYKKDWCESRGYKIEDADEEIGFDGGEIYASFEEFYSNEFLDAGYMRTLLDEDECRLYMYYVSESWAN